MTTTDVPVSLPHGEGALEKGLKTGAIGFVSSVVIGVASTAPGYSLAASLGFVVIAVGFQAPAALLVAFVPMFLIAGSYYSMNRVDPDCGTSFTWVTKGIGPKSGWIAGWALLLADILVMASLSQIAGQYTFLLFGADSLASSVFWVTVIGVIWIIVMTWICYVGIELSAKTQWFLLGAEIVTLALFVVIALWKVYAGDFPDSVNPSLSWLNPFDVSATAMTAGVLACIFIYWGWDTAVAVNEETEDATRTPGIAGVVSTLLLLGIYIGVSYAAIAVHGPQFLVDNADEVLNPLGQDVMPYGLDKLLIIAILTSASASTQTTILPGTRAALSMARARRGPQALRVDSSDSSHARVRHNPLRRDLGRLLRRSHDGQREHPQRLDHGNGAHDRLLPRHHRRGVRRLLPQGALQRPADVRARRARSRAGSRDDGVHLREVGHRPEQSGEFVLRHVASGRAASAGDRDPRPPPRRDPDGAAVVVEPGVLPAQERVGRPGDAAMSGTIVLGYDGSESANAALQETIVRAKWRDAKVVVVFGFYINLLGGTGEGLDPRGAGAGRFKQRSSARSRISRQPTSRSRGASSRRSPPMH